ncbi:hypothetical protein NLJ89_g10783 [Agrocybe chaxingu]|uniref:Uncharacterized protein n=1 Tax=Agrocybe chaxingu TaxID=84603 RepID=A0A9W8MNL1_9AGAR|nr:hypothetical protein NLJ89_g10783 [Agrocybe chaxingu]
MDIVLPPTKRQKTTRGFVIEEDIGRPSVDASEHIFEEDIIEDTPNGPMVRTVEHPITLPSVSTDAPGLTGTGTNLVEQAHNPISYPDEVDEGLASTQRRPRKARNTD